MSFVIFDQSIAMEIKEDSLNIPTAEITLIWEHYCMKHMAHSEWHLARLNQKAIEFQKSKMGYDADPNQFSHFQKKLEEARAAKAGISGSWGCNPPEAKLVFVELKVGQSSETKISESFISNTDNSVETRAAVLIDSGCKQPRIEWDTSVQKYGLQHKISEANLTAAVGSQDMIVPSSGLSGDETVWGCIDDPGIPMWGMRCGYIVYEVNKDSFNFMSELEHTFAIPKAPLGDRADNFKVDVEAKLSCQGALTDTVSATVSQDEKDQLRQEYLDMEKKAIPKREELTDQGDTKHFTVSEFNASQKVSGEKYAYILSRVLEKLETIRSRVSHVLMAIHSGYRNPYKNAKVPGSGKESPHLYGIAVDFEFDDFDWDKEKNHQDREFIFKVAKQVGACIEPEQKTPTWVHLDWRATCPNGW